MAIVILRPFSKDRGLVDFNGWPWLTAVNRDSEYTALKNMTMARGKISGVLVAIIGGSRQSSPRKLIEGGAAIFVATNRKNSIVMGGNKDRTPLVKNSLRVI